MGLRTAVISIAVLLVPSAFAFTQSIADLIKSSPVPETVDALRLPDNFKAVQLKTTAAETLGGYSEIMMASSYAGQSSSDMASRIEVYQLAQMSWTSGQVITVDGVDFLVTYKMGSSPDSAGREMVPDHNLRLTLVRKDSIVEISPRSDFTAERLRTFFVPTAQQVSASTKTRALSNLKQVELGMVMYMADYDDLTPYAQDTKSAFAAIMPYLKGQDLFKSQNPNKSRILLNMAIAGVGESDVPNPAETVMFYDENAWPGNQHLVGFMDGHVKFMDEEAWTQAAKSLHLKIKRRAKPLPPDYWKKLFPTLDVGD